MPWFQRVFGSRMLRQHELERTESIWHALNSHNANRTSFVKYNWVGPQRREFKIQTAPDSAVYINAQGARVAAASWVKKVAATARLMEYFSADENWNNECVINNRLPLKVKNMAWKEAYRVGVTIANYNPPRIVQLQLIAEVNAERRAAASRQLPPDNTPSGTGGSRRTQRRKRPAGPATPPEAGPGTASTDGAPSAQIFSDAHMQAARARRRDLAGLAAQVAQAPNLRQPNRANPYPYFKGYNITL
jgi:hypothetical protein